MYVTTEQDESSLFVTAEWDEEKVRETVESNSDVKESQNSVVHHNRLRRRCRYVGLTCPLLTVSYSLLSQMYV